MQIVQQRPTHQQVRDFMKERKAAVTPPPSPEEIRRQLGWGMLVKLPDCPR